MADHPTAPVNQRAGTAAVMIALGGFGLGQLAGWAWGTSWWWVIPCSFLGAVGLAGLGDTIERARKGER